MIERKDVLALLGSIPFFFIRIYIHVLWMTDLNLWSHRIYEYKYIREHSIADCSSSISTWRERNEKTKGKEEKIRLLVWISQISITNTMSYWSISQDFVIEFEKKKRFCRQEIEVCAHTHIAHGAIWFFCYIEINFEIKHIHTHAPLKIFSKMNWTSSVFQHLFCIISNTGKVVPLYFSLKTIFQIFIKFCDINEKTNSITVINMNVKYSMQSYQNQISTQISINEEEENWEFVMCRKNAMILLNESFCCC